MNNIFDSFYIQQLEIKNRFVMAPMCLYVASDDGMVQPFHRVHYPARAYGGVGLIITEATAVEPRGRITSHDLGIWSDEHIPGLKELVELVHQGGAKIGIQLAHAGRKCKADNEVIIAPSAIAYSSDYSMPAEMTDTDIHTVIQAFKNGARRAKLIGYDCIELHGAHGYLINQFLSPLTNHRHDRYGGSFENRIRFLHEVIDAVRLEWEGPLILRLSAEEYAVEGNHIADTLRLIDSLNHCVDAINVSSGGVVSVKFDAYPGYQISYAKAIKDKGYTVIGGGLFTSYDEIEPHLDSVDAIYLGRILLNNPNFVLSVASRLNRNDLVISPYERGFK